jgi:hypothetical protein
MENLIVLNEQEFDELPDFSVVMFKSTGDRRGFNNLVAQKLSGLNSRWFMVGESQPLPINQELFDNHAVVVLSHGGN